MTSTLSISNVSSTMQAAHRNHLTFTSQESYEVYSIHLMKVYLHLTGEKTHKCPITCLRCTVKKWKNQVWKPGLPISTPLYINNLNIVLFPTNFNFLIISCFKSLREKALKAFNLSLVLLWHHTICTAPGEITANMVCYNTVWSLGIYWTPMDC